MNNIVSEKHKKTTIGRTTQQLLKDLEERGQKISKGYLLQLTNDLRLKERGLVSVISQMTKKGMRPHNIYLKEATKEIIMSVNKMFPEEKKEYLIGSTKTQLPSLAEIKQIGLALAGISETIENQQKKLVSLEDQQKMCRVSAREDNELLKFQENIVRHRLYKKNLSWDDNSARQKEFQFLRGYLGREIGISRVTNLNTKEHKLVRDILMEIIEWERIPY